MRVICFTVCLAAVAMPVNADVLTFEDDYPGFVEAAGPLSEIDFETLPDGSPSMSSVEITDTFNYDDQGVHFSAPFPYPYIAGNPESGFDLQVFQNFEDTWIIGDLITPAQAVGGFFGGTTELCAFDDIGSEIACVIYSDPGPGNFVGIVSDVPIHSLTFSDGTNSESIDAFVFSPVPEPGTLALIGSGVLLLIRRRVCRRR